MASLRSRPLHADEARAFDELREWLDFVKPEMGETHRRRLRIFFQDHPVRVLRIEEEFEA